MDRLSADRMFVEVARRGSFSAAAARLGCSAGQASKLVSALEARLGVRLLIRTTRAVSLTPEGEEYLPRIAAILDQMTELDDRLRSNDGQPRGLLRLTAPLTFGTAQLMPALADFARAHPAIRLDVDFTDSIVSLAEGGFDAAIRVGQPRDSAMVAHPLGVMTVVAVASPAYLDARGTPRTPDALEGHDFITDMNFVRPDDWTFGEGGDAVTIRATGRLRFSNAEACVTAAIAGLGITRVPDFIAAPHLRDGRLVQVLGDFPQGQSPVMALAAQGRHIPSRLRLLIRFLQDRWGPGHGWAD